MLRDFKIPLIFPFNLILNTTHKNSGFIEITAIC